MKDMNERARFSNHIDGNAFLRAVIDSAPEGIVIADNRGDVILMNRAADRLYTHPAQCGQAQAGYTEPHRIEDVNGAPYDTRDLPLTRSALCDETHTGVELSIVWMDDCRRELLMNTAPIKDEHGAPMGAIGIFQDITRYIRAAQDVRESRQQVIDILNSITDAFISLDNDWRFTYINKKAETLLQKRKEEVLYRNIWDAFPDTISTAFYHEFQRAKLENVQISFEEYYPPLGLWFSVHAYPYKSGLSVYFSDNTERKATEQALYENRELLASIIDNTSAIVFVKDMQGRFMLVNKRFEELFGVNRVGLIGKSDFDLLGIDQAQMFDEHDREVLTTGQLREFEEVIHVNSITHTYISIKFPLKNACGDIYALCGIATDITDRKQTEEELKASEERFRATFELAAVGIAHVDLDGSFIRLNQRYCDIVGYSKDELRNTKFQDITHPDDVETDLMQARKLLEGKLDTYSMEKRYIKKDGSIVWVNLLASIVRDATKPLCYITVVEDISQRKYAEEPIDRN